MNSGYKLGEMHKGQRISTTHYLNGELLSFGTNKTVYWVVNVLKKHIEALKDAVCVWKKRKLEAIGKEKGNAQCHLDYLENQLQKEMKARDELE